MRQLFKWNVKLQADTGEVIDYPIEAYWHPERDDTPAAIMASARGEAFWSFGRKKEFAPISVERV